MNGEVCQSKDLLVTIQENGIIRRHDTGYILGRLSDHAKYEDLPNETVKPSDWKLLDATDPNWTVTIGKGEINCHSKNIGGVLCRWWGNGEPPSGVKSLEEIKSTHGGNS